MPQEEKQLTIIPLRRFIFALIMIIVAALSGFSLAQGPGGGLSFFDAVSLALNSDDNIAAAEANWQSSRAGINSAKSAYWPTLALASSYSHITNVSEISITIPPPLNIVENIKTATANPFDANVALNWEVYTFGRRSSGVELARAEAHSSEITYNQARKQIFDATARAYLTAVFTQSSYELVETEKERFERIYGLEEERFNQQLIPEFDLLQMRLRLVQYEKSLLESANTQRSAELNLATLLDIEVEGLPALADSLSPEILKLPDQNALQDALNRRDDYRQAQANYQMAGLGRTLKKSSYFPSLFVAGSYDLRNGYQPDLNKLESNFSVGAKLNWLIFDGFGRKAEIAGQDYLWKASDYLMNDLKRKIPPQMQNAYLTMENKQSKIEVGQKALQVAKKAMSIAQTRYDLGDISMIDLLDTENNLAQSESSLLQMKYELMLAQLDYKKAAAYYPELELPE